MVKVEKKRSPGQTPVVLAANDDEQSDSRLDDKSGATLVVTTPCSNVRQTVAARAVSGTQTGRATFFSPSLGTCGITNTDSDLIAAVSSGIFATTPVTVQVTDTCVSCTDNDLDLSTGAFSQLADLSVGSIPVTWSFN
ncbi:RlpA-like double-psi beta-barrel-protein domain-containing protein-containing protein [Russula brevipes]|nr:RlpA-like double-psi beta-barrel-protein domain-containing protein-containing protein [Russula brevipes]